MKSTVLRILQVSHIFLVSLGRQMSCANLQRLINHCLHTDSVRRHRRLFYLSWRCIFISRSYIQTKAAADGRYSSLSYTSSSWIRILGNRYSFPLFSLWHLNRLHFVPVIVLQKSWSRNRSANWTCGRLPSNSSTGSGHHLLHPHRRSAVLDRWCIRTFIARSWVGDLL